MIDVLNIPNAYKEVYTILKYVDKNDLNLISQDFIEIVKSNMNESYEFEYNINLSFEEQNILRETKAILAYIFLNYWANDKQVIAIKEQFKKDLLQEEKKKTTTEMQSINQTTMLKYKESIFIRFKNWIKILWSRK